MQIIDQNILELKKVEDQLAELTAKKEELRKEIFGIVENEGLTDGYKNEYASVSYVARKSIKFQDKEALLEDLKKKKLVKYFQVIPEQVIPEHLEFTPEFEKDVKDETFTHKQVELDVKNNLAIKFAK